MEWLTDTLTFNTTGKGMYMITVDISSVIKRWKIQSGMCFIFLPHTMLRLHCVKIMILDHGKTWKIIMIMPFQKTSPGTNIPLKGRMIPLLISAPH